MNQHAGLPELAPVVALVLLAEFAAGTIVVTYALDALERVGRGFAGTTSIICAAVMAMDLLVAVNLPETGSLLHGPVSAGDVASLAHWSVALTLMLLAYGLFCAVGTEVARHTVGIATVLVAAMVLVRSAIAFGPPLGGAPAALLVILPAALLAGSATAGMLLGHWYLISPDLSFRPLRRAVYLIFIAVALQVVCISGAIVASHGHGRDELLGSSLALLFWLLVVGSGVVFTAGVNGLTLYFARMRANQPATAMLYVLIITVLMGLVPAHLLYFRTAVPV